MNKNHEIRLSVSNNGIPNKLAWTFYTFNTDNIFVLVLWVITINLISDYYMERQQIVFPTDIP